MSRPKGSKNKKPAMSVELTDVSDQITAVEVEIATITDQLKAKKNELKALLKEKAKADKIAAAKKAEEDKVKLLEAVAASGRAIEEVLEMLK